jgi:hypothetical protein
VYQQKQGLKTEESWKLICNSLSESDHQTRIHFQLSAITLPKDLPQPTSLIPDLGSLPLPVVQATFVIHLEPQRFVFFQKKKKKKSEAKKTMLSSRKSKEM